MDNPTRPIVVKIGGAKDVDPDGVCADLAAVLERDPLRSLVLVHGGSADTNALGEALGHPPRFVTSPSGHESRLTDARTLEIFLMATAGLNRRLVASLQGRGVNALGLSGLDGRLLEAERKEAIRVVEEGRVRILRDDWTGKPVRANAALLELLIEAGYVPVVAPVAISEKGEPLNVDGDRAAACIAGALGAEALLLLTGAPGVLARFPDESTLIPHIEARDLPAALERVEGRMKKKLLGAQEALAAGLERVVIAGSRGPTPLASALAGGGTLIGAAWPARTRAARSEDSSEISR